MTAHDRDQAWARLGELLRARRAQIDPRYHNKRLFCAERGVSYRVVSDIETARRQNFTADVLASLESAYKLASGAIAEAIENGPVESLRPEVSVAELPVSRGVLLVPVPDDMTPAERRRVQQWASQMAEDLVRMREEATGPKRYDGDDNR